jgi:hypothetical protein
MKLAQMPFPPETRRRILGENALRLFSIDEQGRRLRRRGIAGHPAALSGRFSA